MEQTAVAQPGMQPLKRTRVHSKRKGSGFENHVAKLLSKALTPMEFRRSQSSGAVLGGVNARDAGRFSADARALFVGDVVPTNESDAGWRFRFEVECKSYKTPPNLEHLFANDQLKSWFAQAAADAQKLGKEPLLIFKFNHTGIFGAVDERRVLLPPVVVRRLTVTDAASGLSPATFTIFRLKEALLDLSWWRLP